MNTATKLTVVSKPKKLTKAQKLELDLAQTQATLKEFEEEKAKAEAKSDIEKNLRDAFAGPWWLLPIGIAFGAFVPCAAWWFGHHEVDAAKGWLQLPTLVILGCLIYSSITIYAWMKEFTGIAAKAIGFVIALEIVMLTTKAAWLEYWALGLLVFVNAVVGASNVSSRKVSK